MSRRSFLFTFCCLVQVLGLAFPTFADRIVMQEGKGRNLSGAIVLINPEKVVIDVRGEKQEIPANIIAYTVFDNEPTALSAARQDMIGSRMSEALDSLGKLDAKSLSESEMKAEYDYISAVAKAGLYLDGSGKWEDAEKELLGFIRKHGNSYHYYEICELRGDVMIQAGKYEDAEKSYTALAKAPWPEYRLKAMVLLGMAEVNEEKFEAARRNFNSVISAEDGPGRTDRIKGMAEIGLALCLVGDKKYDDAIKSLEELAKRSATEDSDFQSLLFNSLGSAYDRAGKPGLAILSYYHTDILFSSARAGHIKALTELSGLWRKIKRADRAEAVEQKLKDLYNVSVE